LSMLEYLEVDDLSLGTWSAMGLFVMPYTKTPGAQSLIEGMKTQATYYEAAAALALQVPKAVIPAMRAGDPECLASLPEGQRAELQAAAREVSALGEGLSWPHPDQLEAGAGPAKAPASKLGSAVHEGVR
jgi:hypothetical protein